MEKGETREGSGEGRPRRLSSHHQLPKPTSLRPFALLPEPAGIVESEKAQGEKSDGPNSHLTLTLTSPHITLTKAIFMTLGLKGWKGLDHIHDFQTVLWGPSQVAHKILLGFELNFILKVL